MLIERRYSTVFMTVLLRRRVDWPMLDVAGVVFYPQYWDLAHRFFEESWESICGIDYPTLTDERKLGFPAVYNECEFLGPLRYGDEAVCTLWIENVGDSSCIWRYRMANQHGDVVWTGKVVTVCVDLETFAKRSLPEELSRALAACTED